MTDIAVRTVDRPCPRAAACLAGLREPPGTVLCAAAVYREVPAPAAGQACGGRVPGDA